MLTSHRIHLHHHLEFTLHTCATEETLDHARCAIEHASEGEWDYLVLYELREDGRRMPVTAGDLVERWHLADFVKREVDPMTGEEEI